ncbi:hypothetical protein A2625_06190 [candidate division WOR-1 bacterium RIFCSPHIGHO2_01_FULL_53_15]|uniref:AAA family ATPase n=1 Tax=candidate division WOR-1 bacterium RIFCSPHIGHO2_01_FULL_53_15 TaxID=1802564 RepID=A0A1F4Q1R7_UNCSA|nr:MAG: hypothetical protein A2625_06190 [candidate division WOR-1 bacterium RIFCSPHIGHO2_01_FULL_53_15]OGC13902.1 MAG: hypothetical protein A3D23_02030 [candidate division WOR-1 bacterium RIFCSPHIGHO2_02_FULL_53_26]
MLLKDHLEKTGQTGHYLNLENAETLKALNEHPLNLFELIPAGKTKMNVFIDEIQYLDSPTNFLKLLYDENRERVKIIASGSSAFYIDEKFKDSLAGRKFLFELYPLNFHEFLVFKQASGLLGQKLSVYSKKRKIKLWTEYIIYGGYPKIVLTEEEELKKILLEEIGSAYVKKDIVEAGIKNTDKYFALLKILAEQTGCLVNSQELANTLNLAHKTIEDYLHVMKKSYQIAFVRPFYKNLRKELTKMPKAYFYDLGLRNFFMNDYSKPERRPDKGAYLENVVFRELLGRTTDRDNIKYWRTQEKNEVDFVAGSQAFEVKFDLKGLKRKKYSQFQKEYPAIELTFLAYDTLMEYFYP